MRIDIDSDQISKKNMRIVILQALLLLVKKELQRRNAVFFVFSVIDVSGAILDEDLATLQGLARDGCLFPTPEADGYGETPKNYPVMQYQQIGTPKAEWQGLSGQEFDAQLIGQLALNSVKGISSKPKLIVTFGNTGTGKSTLAKRVIEMAGLASGSGTEDEKVAKYLVDDLVEPQEVFKVLGWIFLNAAGHVSHRKKLA